MTSTRPRDETEGEYQMSSNSSALIEFLDNLKEHEFEKIFKEPLGCLSIFRWLPKLAQFIVSRMLLVYFPLKWNIVRSWTPKTLKSMQNSALWTLKQWKILKGKDSFVWLNKSFQQTLLRAFRTNLSKDSPSLVKINSNGGNTASIISTGNKKWENVLMFMAVRQNPQESVDPPPDRILDVLVGSGLMSLDKRDPSKLIPPKYDITHSGFQFLLQNINVQIWCFLVSYMEFFKNIDRIDILLFLFQLGFSELGSEYKLKFSSHDNKIFIQDLKSIGLVCQKKDLKTSHSTQPIYAKYWLERTRQILYTVKHQDKVP